MMTTANTIDHGDGHDCEGDRHYESPQLELLHTRTMLSLQRQRRSRSTTGRDLWRRLYLVIQAYGAFTRGHNRKKKNYSPVSTTVTTDIEPAGLSSTSGDDDDDETPTHTTITIHDDDGENINDDYISWLTNNPNVDINPPTSDDDHSDDVVTLVIHDVEVLPTQPTSSLETLSSIIKEKNLDSLSKLGGVERIAAALNTHLEHGICSSNEELHCRRVAYGSNIYGDHEVLTHCKSFSYFVFKACKDWTIVLLFCCASLSLGSGIKEEGLTNGWIDGSMLFFIIFVLIAVTSIRNYRGSRRSLKLLNDQKTQAIQVRRRGLLQQISISDVVVGDLVCLKIGEWVPADGLFITNGIDDNHLKVDDDSRNIDPIENPFLFYGTKVIEGSGLMLVTSVGMNTALGEMMSLVNYHVPKKGTPLLHVRFDKMNTYLQNIGLLLSILIIVVLLLRYLLEKKEHNDPAYQNQISKKTLVENLMKDLERFLRKPRGIMSWTTMLAVLLVGTLEGLPLIFTISLFYWNEKMVKNQIVIRKLCSCATMSSVTTLCIDKTEGLTLNEMVVDVFRVGDQEAISGEIMSSVSQNVREPIYDGVGSSILMSGTPTNPIEDLLVCWAELKLGMDMEVLKQSRTVLVADTHLSSENKSTVLLMKKSGDAENTFHLHWRGPAETILGMCSHYYNSDGMIIGMDERKRVMFAQGIEDVSTSFIALAYRPIIEEDGGDDIVDYSSKLYEDGLILVGLFGIKYPCSPEARRAVDVVKHAGVSIKLVSEQKLSVLRTIAIECGIIETDLEANSMVFEGEEFMKLSEEQRLAKVDQIVVMGSSLPSDRLLFVQCLKQKRHVVAVTGARSVDSPTLNEAHVGLLMGTTNSEMAKESSGIVILNDSFASTVTVLLFGRCAYQNIRKFIQVALIINISGLLITFVTKVSLGDAPPLQLFLVNLIVCSLAAFTMMTEPPNQELLEMSPIKETEPLITKAMWRNIIIQVSYQATILLIFQFKGQAIPGMNQMIMNAMIFNGFVLCQVFNMLNARELEKKNVFKGVLSNYWLLFAVGGSIVLQVVVVEFGTSLTKTSRLDWLQWLACVLFAIASWPIDCAGKSLSVFFFSQSFFPENANCATLWAPRFTTS